MFALLAMLCFLLATLGVDIGELSTARIVYLGLFFLALAMLVGNWPIGVIRIGRREN